MPSGMLDTLEESQIFDLLAYLLSDGNSERSAFHSTATTTKASRDAK